MGCLISDTQIQIAMKYFLYFFLLYLPLLVQSQIFLTPLEDSIPMRDGKKLAADVYKPSGCSQCPTILIQTPYNRKTFRAGLPFGTRLDIDSSPYNFVVVDWRGFYGSLKAFKLNANRGEDGYDVVEWIAVQSWSDGQIATWGPSALANIQYLTAREHPPHLVCAVPVVGAPQTKYEEYYPGGALKKGYVEQLDALGFGLSGFILANQVKNIVWDIAERSSYYPDEIGVPMFMIGGWYDHNIAVSLEFFQGLQTLSADSVKNQHKFLIGPWVHGGTGLAFPGSAIQGELNYPEAAHRNDTLTRQFLDYYLLQTPNGWEQQAPVTFYQMGENRWEYAQQWPVHINTHRLYLRPDLRLDFQNEPVEHHLALTYDPRDPSPTVGGATLQLGLNQGPYDQKNQVENRNDHLIFSTAVLEQDVRIQGRVKLNLLLSSNRLDSDVAIRLTDVYPDGRSMLVNDGIRRLRFRNGFRAQDTSVLNMRQIYPIEVELPDVALTFQAGHQIRVIITGSNYPRYDPNLNNGGEMYVAGDTLIAQNTFYMGGIYDAYVELPTEQALAVDEDLSLPHIHISPILQTRSYGLSRKKTEACLLR